jgi:hypothetical protein
MHLRAGKYLNGGTGNPENACKNWNISNPGRVGPPLTKGNVEGLSQGLPARPAAVGKRKLPRRRSVKIGTAFVSFLPPLAKKRDRQAR